MKLLKVYGPLEVWTRLDNIYPVISPQLYQTRNKRMRSSVLKKKNIFLNLKYLVQKMFVVILDLFRHIVASCANIFIWNIQRSHTEIKSASVLGTKESKKYYSEYR